MNVKDLILKPIESKHANMFIKKHHYSGKVVNNSVLHFGVFYNDILSGVMSFGSPLDKRKVLPLVKDTKWNEMFELNRMAFIDSLPKNSESRCISVAMRIIKKTYPHIKWILSFADGTQCGDGTIYRASGFNLVLIKENHNTVRFGDSIIHKMTLESNPIQKRPELGGKSYYDITNGKYNFNKYCEYVGGVILSGYQLKYIYLIDKSCEITAPILPFSKIDEMGAGMYKGKKRKLCDSSSKRERSTTSGKVAV